MGPDINPGKWYFETYFAFGATSYGFIGLIGQQGIPTTVSLYPGSQADSYGYYNNGWKYNNSQGVAWSQTFGNADIIGCSYDTSNGEIRFYKNGVDLGVAFTAVGAVLAPGVGVYNVDGGVGWHLHFGTRQWIYPPPAGFKCLCTQNMQEPSIKRGDDYMTAHLRNGVGTGAAYTVTGKRFKPDIVWIKQRSGTRYNMFSDAVRGPYKTFFVNEPTAETDYGGNGVVSFNADGYSGGADANYSEAGSYVDWLFRKGAISGIDVVNYTGNGGAITLSHSLGKPPWMFVTKARTGPAMPWNVYHGLIGPQNYVQLDDTPAYAAFTNIWNPPPTSTQFSIGAAAGGSNAAGINYTAYLFTSIAGFSHVWWYHSNQDTNGPVVYCGFRPRWVLVKNVSVAASWYVFDSSRDGVNPVQLGLFTSTPDAEFSSIKMDFLSSGFKLRTAGDPNVGTPHSHIVLAFAEHPFKYARAR